MLVKGSKIFCIGLGQTDSELLGAALIHLGFRCLRWDSQFSSQQILRWHEGKFGKKCIETIRDHDAFENFPWPLYYEDIDKLCPNAKFILTTKKDSVTWLNSIQHHLSKFPKWIGNYLIYGSYDPSKNPDVYQARYESHNDAVRKYFSSRPGKLLEFCCEQNDGWKKLCAFLRREIPRNDFPRSTGKPESQTSAIFFNGIKSGGNSAKKELIIHIGVHRTATTTIQYTMQKNSRYLISHGYFYPQHVQRHGEIFDPIFWGKTTAKQVANDLIQRAENNSSPIHTLVISDENISMWRDLRPLEPLQNFFNMKFIISMRRQDLWLESWWPLCVTSQVFKESCHISWSDFLASRATFHWIDYDRRLQEMEKLFGKENIRASVFEKSQMPEGPVVPFCRHLGLDDISGLTPLKESVVNFSVLPEIAEFLRHLPLHEAEFSMRYGTLIKAIMPIEEKLRSGNPMRLMMSFDERQKIMREYEAGNTSVAQRYFSRDQLFLEPLPGSDTEAKTPELPESTADLIERFVQPYFHELIKILNAKV